MRARRPTCLAAALAIALGAAGAAAQDSRYADGVAAGVARALLDEARAAAGIGDWAKASACLDEAVARDPGDSDVLYLRSLAIVKRASPLVDALGGLDGALATGRFSYYSKRDAYMLKAEILVRERRWREALAALDQGGRDLGADPSYRLIRARAEIGLGDQTSFLTELSSALARFPDDPAFARLFLVRAGRLAVSEAARELGSTVLGRLSRYVEADPELPVLAAPLMLDAAARTDAVLAYRAAGGKSAAATLRALEYGLIDEATASSEMLSGSYQVTFSSLKSLFSLAGSPKGRAEVTSALASWTGKVESDSDGDGIPEASFSISKGHVKEWESDSGQDGAIDQKAAFSDGIPISVSIDRAGLAILVEYSAYPAVDSISFDESTGRRSYFFGPEALSFAPLAMRPFAETGDPSLLFPNATQVADPSERSCAMAALSVVVQAGSSRRVTVLENGRPLSSADYDGDRLVSTTAYERGKPSFERMDVDGDGRFESERRYYSGETTEVGKDPSWLRTDSDGDGVFEYREQSAFPFRKEWDYDGNGSVDAARFLRADGSIEQEFSSRLDGRLDESVVLRDGRIVSLSRDGVALAFSPDSNPDLTWIGKKSFDLGRNLPPGEGLFTEMGKRYRLTRVGKLAFAELVP